MNDKGSWLQKISLVLTAFEEENRRGYLPDVSGDEDMMVAGGTCQILVAMKEDGSSRSLPNVKGDEGKWQQDTSLIFTAFEEKDGKQYLTDVKGDEGR